MSGSHGIPQGLRDASLRRVLSVGSRLLRLIRPLLAIRLTPRVPR